jgi:DNA primase
MRGRIPEETLTELRDRAGIVDVVSAHVGLRKVGRNHLGLCPFHAEKTPSFTVNADRGIFHCFGCGAGGNVFTFLMRMESLPFPEVVERLARRYGVTLPERAADDPTVRLRESMFRLNDQTARFFQRYLWEGAEARPARDYLVERGIGRAVAECFLLGYAPGGGDVLARRLEAAGRPHELAVRLGLIGERRGGGGCYDRFRARLMFPITDSSGRVVGFGSRSVPGTASVRGDLPKYLNSPETPLYRKGAHLYGLALARDAIRAADSALVVEGYFDVLALAEAGIAHAVASLGTALTLVQLQVLKRFTRNVIAFFDGDAAGEKAAEKSLPTFLEAGLWGRAAFLPSGDDPDTFVRREGRDAVLALLAGAAPLLEFYLDRAVRPESTPAERAAVARQVAQWLAKIADPFEYDITARRTAERLGVAEELLRRQPVRVPAGTGRAPLAIAPAAASCPDASATGAAVVAQPVTGSAAGSRGDTSNASVAAAAGAAATGAPGPEALLVELMLCDPAAAERVDSADGLALFDDPGWRAIAEEVVATVRRGGTVDAAMMLSRLNDAAAARIAGRLLSDAGDEACSARGGEASPAQGEPAFAPGDAALSVHGGAAPPTPLAGGPARASAGDASAVRLAGAPVAVLVDDCLRALAERARRRRRRAVVRQIREAETQGNRTAVDEGLRELQELRRNLARAERDPGSDARDTGPGQDLGRGAHS